MSNLFKKFDNDVSLFLDYLKGFLNSKNYLSSDLRDAISYSVFRGGKRIRPIFSFAVAKSLSKDSKDVFKFAGAIELIHNYSLVHDDLPEMDNDDYRRGLESTHKKYGNAIGLLSGDALLSLANELAIYDLKEDNSVNKIEAYELLFNRSGASGMIDGQAFECKLSNIDDYIKVITKKTANLFVSSITGTALYLGASKDLVKTLYDFSILIGQTFQLLDDYIDHENDDFLCKFNFDLKTEIEKNKIKLDKLIDLLNVSIDVSYLKYIYDEMISNSYLKNES